MQNGHNLIIYGRSRCAIYYAYITLLLHRTGYMAIALFILTGYIGLGRIVGLDKLRYGH